MYSGDLYNLYQVIRCIEKKSILPHFVAKALDLDVSLNTIQEIRHSNLWRNILKFIQKIILYTDNFRKQIQSALNLKSVDVSQIPKWIHTYVNP